MSCAETTRDWFTLDNAARIYPGALSEWSPDVYRISATLRAPIRVSTLAEAMRTVLPRFPYFQVHLRRGLFWYYLQRSQAVAGLFPMTDVPVSAMPEPIGGGYLLRAQARGATIAVDFSHVLTDGAGAICFLGTLVTRYLQLRGTMITNWAPFLDPDTPPEVGEFEDAYDRYQNPGLPAPPRLSSAYHLPDQAEGRSRVITGRLPLDDVLGLARQLGVSLTAYLVAVYMDAMARVREATGGGHPVLRIEVPVDMRRLLPSQTMRNFSLFVSPEIDLRLGRYTFEEIVQRVHHLLRLQVDRKELSRQVARNVRAAHLPLLRVLPLRLKDPLFALVRERFGETPYSGVLSNVGRIEVPADILPEVESFDVMLGPNPRMKKTCVVLSFRDDLVVNFGSVVASRALERLFFTHFVRAGVRVGVSERSGDR